MQRTPFARNTFSQNDTDRTHISPLGAQQSLRSGELLSGRFRVEHLAAVGAQAQVFRAYDTLRQRRVALKLETQRAGSARRFRDEAQALSQSASPWLVGYVDRGVTAAGQAFLVLDWVEGPTLAHRLARAGLRPLEALELCRRLGLGLAAMHARGIVHRDLKPANIMLAGARSSAPKIVDLGVARLSDMAAKDGARDTYVGTPRYMSPEQIRDPHQVDGRADVFALGSILFECLTGTAAFVASEIPGVLAQILFEPTPTARSRRPELPGAIDVLLARLLAPSPTQRPRAGAELAAQFARARAACGSQLAELSAAKRQPLDTSAETALCWCDASEWRASRGHVGRPTVRPELGPSTGARCGSGPSMGPLSAASPSTQCVAG